jgi:hypothetical protein
MIEKRLGVRGGGFRQPFDHFADVFVVFDWVLVGNSRFDRLHRCVERAPKELKLTERFLSTAGLEAVYQSGCFICGLLVEFHE